MRGEGGKSPGKAMRNMLRGELKNSPLGLSPCLSLRGGITRSQRGGAPTAEEQFELSVASSLSV